MVNLKAARFRRLEPMSYWALPLSALPLVFVTGCVADVLGECPESCSFGVSLVLEDYDGDLSRLHIEQSERDDRGAGADEKDSGERSRTNFGKNYQWVFHTSGIAPEQYCLADDIEIYAEEDLVAVIPSGTCFERRAEFRFSPLE